MNSGVHNYVASVDTTDRGAAQVKDSAGTAQAFVNGSRWANPTAEISPGVWGPGSVKPG